MATALSPPKQAEQRVVLYRVSWKTYEQLLADFTESHAAHFAYDQGTLEIMVLSFEHENLKHTLATLVELLAGELEIDVEGGGSTTFRREDLGKGFEPDACFYVQNAERMRGKKQIDLSEDPPPDLVIEINITNPSLNKFPIFAGLKVPEVWRFDGTVLTIFKLEGGEYTVQESSVALPGLTSQVLTRFLRDSQTMKRTAWLRHVREWARKQAKADR